MDTVTTTSLPTVSLPIAEGSERIVRGKDSNKKDKRKVVRRDPEKRRQQNLQAQKKYREKLRKRLEDLETLAASVAVTKKTATNGGAEATSPVTPIDDKTSSPEQTSQTWSSPNSSGEDASQNGAQAPFTSALDVFVPAVVDDVSMDMSIWDPATCIDPSYFTMTNYGKPDTEREFWPTTYVDCGCFVRHVEVRTKGPGCHGKGRKLIRVGETQVFSDPYLNHIRMDAMCTISAMWENCLQLGISEWMLCDEDSQSPFYRPGPSTSLITNNKIEAVDGVVRTVQSIWKTLKPDIRPTREQITIPHHPCLDVFPFPTFRKNVLKATVVFDDDEFFCDALEGLTCWGGSGIGRGDRKGATGKTSTGTPWDHRSWEAKPWFIRKYWIVLGGEDGELVRQSEWWRGTRGEEVDIWSGEAPGPPSDLSKDLLDAGCMSFGFLTDLSFQT
ncbi:hypothetical protein N0V93_004024 [Gnomoniopsis smithogilvyi]|uniref:BZIP domain-containing protein n=1 Tax=Gnomoniopsis smithogilvyi TaxID=1191159 RepID=A0A9W8YXR2_9PEZI|nr:hypothetical protein N0V93_004024 [Gnomoniopsis smithogilvyi]